VYLRTKHKEQITKNAEGSTKQPMTSLRTTRPWVHGLILLTIFLGVLTAGMSWELNHGLMLALAGGLMLLSPPVAKLPTSWWWLAGAFAIFGCLVFLPVGGLPFWREELEKAGLATGHLRAVQVRLAGETLLLWVATLGVGLWIVGQRTSDEGLKVWALGFALVVAAYTLASIGKSELAQDLGGKPEVFGFFPNRNHTATFLAMGAMVSIAVLAQAIRDKRWWGLGFGAAATGVCLWGALIESESRAGLLLVVVGVLIYYSTRVNSVLLLNLAIAGFGLQVTTRYFDIFWDLLSGSLLFIVTGIVLFGGGLLLEVNRRKVIQHIQREERQ